MDFDLDSFEEMLFDFPSSQSVLGETWEGTLGDEMLFESLPVPPSNRPPARSLQPVEPWVEDDMDFEMLGLFSDSTKHARATSCSSGRAIAVTRDRQWVIGCIENMLDQIVNCLQDDRGQLSITLATRSGTTGRALDPSKGIIVATRPVKTRAITFPGSSVQEAWKFTVLVRILELIHYGLIENTIMTKRDLYYRHPDLFMKQSVVDRYVDDLACTFGVSRSLLNITAAAKGLVGGNFILVRSDGSRVNGMSDREGLLVPRLQEEDKIDLVNVRCIVVVEKEATFRSLLSSPSWDEIGSCAMILTAKGYPDLASRVFLRQIADHIPDVPVYALVDFDPDGIAIMSTYKYGSYQLAHEVGPGSAPAAEHLLSLPRLRWLGVRCHQISLVHAAEGLTTADMSNVQGLMHLTERDRKKASRMLEWEMCAEDGPEPEWRWELQRMLLLNIKGEMQVLEAREGGLAGWVMDQIGMHKAV